MAVHEAIVARAIRSYTEDDNRRKTAGTAKAAAEAAKAVASATAVDASAVVGLLGGDSSASGKKKAAAPAVDPATALAKVSASAGLQEIAWPTQRLVDKLAEAKANTPGKVLYIELAKEAKPEWVCDYGADEESDDELLDQRLKAFANAVRGEPKKGVGQSRLPLHVWAAAYQVKLPASVFSRSRLLAVGLHAGGRQRGRPPARSSAVAFRHRDEGS